MSRRDARHHLRVTRDEGGPFSALIPASKNWVASSRNDRQEASSVCKRPRGPADEAIAANKTKAARCRDQDREARTFYRQEVGLGLRS